MDAPIAPPLLPLSVRLGGRARVAQIVFRLFDRMRSDAVLAPLVRGVALREPREDGQSALEEILARWCATPSAHELQLDMIVGHLVATLVDLNVGPGPTRDVVRLIERYRSHARVA